MTGGRHRCENYRSDGVTFCSSGAKLDECNAPWLIWVPPMTISMQLSRVVSATRNKYHYEAAATSNELVLGDSKTSMT